MTVNVRGTLTLRSVRTTNVVVEKSIGIRYSEYVFVALGSQHAMRMRNIVIRVLPGSIIFFHILS
jgi:hypothetical protein